MCDTDRVPSVLIVDDEPRIASVVRDYLTQAGYEVVEATDGRGALGAIAGHRPDLVAERAFLGRLATERSLCGEDARLRS